ncbi:MAG: protein disulfide oxidoreductase [Candidatus Micrarchaeia archaeon]
MKINEEDKAYLKQLFSQSLKEKVNIIFIEGEGETTKEIKELYEDLILLDERINLVTYQKDSKEAKFLKAELTPATIIGGEKIFNAKFLGAPLGYEFSALIDDIIDASRRETRLKIKTKEFIKSIQKNIDIKVFVTPTCPYCPRAVRIAHQFAMENIRINASMIEAMEFPELADKYGVMAVPKIVINDSISFEGALPEEFFVEQIKKSL